MNLRENKLSNKLTDLKIDHDQNRNNISTLKNESFQRDEARKRAEIKAPEAFEALEGAKQVVSDHHIKEMAVKRQENAEKKKSKELGRGGRELEL